MVTAPECNGLDTPLPTDPSILVPKPQAVGRQGRPTPKGVATPPPSLYCAAILGLRTPPMFWYFWALIDVYVLLCSVMVGLGLLRQLFSVRRAGK